MSENQLTLQQLEFFFWETTDILRGYMDASEFKDFLKYLSNTFDWGGDWLLYRQAKA